MANRKLKMWARELYKYKWWKCIFDCFFALLALAILSPLLVLITIVIRVDSSGNPIFRQERMGKDGRRFMLYKFRTMYENNDDSKYKAFLRKYALENISSRLDDNGQDVYELVRDPRVTRFGNLLRKTNLDELPQLINVLKREMSFIGPRPDIPFIVEMYKDYHWDRLRAIPGVTGLAQVSERRSLSWEDTVRLDIEYINRQSVLLDIKIALLTVREILFRDGR